MMYAKFNIEVVFYLTIILSTSTFALQQATNEAKLELNQLKEPIRTDTRDIWPIVRVDKVNNNSRTDVHVPIFFDMTSENGRNISKLDLSVMHGLVTVNQDKTKDSSGQVSGPMTVTVFGIPVYTGKGTRGSNPQVEAKERARKAEDVLQNQFADISNKTTPVMRDLYLNSRKTNEKILGSFSELFSRAAKKIEDTIQTLRSNSGAPVDIDATKNLVQPAKFDKEDFQPKTSLGSDNTSSSNVTPSKVSDKAQLQTN